MKICNTTGCEEERYLHGWCRRHYTRRPVTPGLADALETAAQHKGSAAPLMLVLAEELRREQVRRAA